MRWLVLLLVMAVASVAWAQSTAPSELGGLRLPTVGSTLIDTNATFAIGLTLDGGFNWRTSAGPQDVLRLVGKVRPEAAQIGQAADVFVVAKVGAAYLMRGSSGAFLPWNGRVADLVPYRLQVTLSAETDVELFNGQLGVSGDFLLFIGYRGADGILRYSARPYAFTINTASTVGSAAAWSFNGSQWQSSGTPPLCPTPLLQTPVDLSKVTSVLYPGQVRGGNYKAHGGFRFDTAGQANQLSVVSAITGSVTRGVRYIESGVVQYLFDVIAPCGVMMRLDHLLELSPKFAAIAATLPPATASTQTTQLSGFVVSAGETVATAAGVPGNVFLDFGIYDLRTRNTATVTQSGELAPYGICWLTALPAVDAARLRSLPAADAVMGSTSDYCR